MLKQQEKNHATLQQQPELLEYINLILSKRKLIFLFPKPLENQFVSKRAADSQSFINTGRYLLIILLLIIVANIKLYHQDIFLENNYKIIKQIYIPLSLAIAFILFSPLINLVRNKFYYFMAPCAIFILAQIIFLSLKYKEDYNDFIVYHLMMAIILMALSLRFVLPLFFLVLSISGAVAIICANVWNVFIDYAKFSNYYILYCCVVLTLTAISEWHERLAFLQRLLLDHHSQQLNLLNQELARIAHEDALTGISNRRSFDETARKEWDRALRDKHPLTLLLLDVDFFKPFNDYYGHSAGDKCLHLVAQTLKNSVLRSSDVVARYGGEEFVILLANTKASGGVQVAERIIRAIDELAIPHQKSEVLPHVSISVGVTTLIATPELSVASLIHQADVALYKAKELGRHQYVVYENLLPKLLLKSSVLD